MDWLNKIIDGQYRKPRGLLGRYIGNRMATDHFPENVWTVSLLQAQPDDWVLELGFGAGVAIQALSQVVTRGRIAGMDFSETMVGAARRRNAAAVKQGLVQLYHGDVSTLPFENSTFDKAYSIHALYFWPKPEKVLREIRRVLKPRGMVVLTMLPKDKWNSASTDVPAGTPECRPYSGAEVEHMLTEVGFRRKQIVSGEDRAVPSKYCVIGWK